MKLQRVLNEVSEQFNLNTTEAGKLSLVLSRLVSGSLDSPNICSPVVDKVGPEKILSGWDEVFNSNEAKVNDVLLSIEKKEREKFGSRSRAKPWSDIKEDFYKFWDNPDAPTDLKPILPSPDHVNRLRPWDLKRVVAIIKNSTSSGLPYLVKKGLVKERFLDPGFLEAEWAKEYPAVPYVRTQEMLKTRIVWGISIANIIYEGRFFYPFLEYQKTLPWRVALLGPDAVDKVITAMVVKAVSQGGILVSLDFTAYDSTLRPELQNIYDVYKCGVFQKQFCDTILDIGKRRVNVPMVTPDGLKTGPHGLPSGSADTNEAGSVIQATIAYDTGLVELGGDSSQFHGDDSASRFDSLEKAESYMKSFVNEKLGINEFKTIVAENYVVFLQRLYHIDYIDKGTLGGIYSSYRALNRIYNFERFTAFLDDEIEGKDFNSIRTISILENCKFHPLFEELVKYVHDLDKYNLNYSETGLRKYIEMLRRTEGTEGIIKNQYGTELSGINSFESVKLINKLNNLE
jgi:hypothetical protein